MVVFTHDVIYGQLSTNQLSEKMIRCPKVLELTVYKVFHNWLRKQNKVTSSVRERVPLGGGHLASMNFNCWRIKLCTGNRVLVHRCRAQALEISRGTLRLWKVSLVDKLKVSVWTEPYPECRCVSLLTPFGLGDLIQCTRKSSAIKLTTSSPDSGGSLKCYSSKTSNRSYLRSSFTLVTAR